MSYIYSGTWDLVHLDVKCQVCRYNSKLITVACASIIHFRLIASAGPCKSCHIVLLCVNK